MRRKRESVPRLANVIVEQVSAMKTRLAANPLAPDAFQLSQLIKKYRKVPTGRANAETLKELRYSLEGDLKKLGVSVADRSCVNELAMRQGLSERRR